MRSTAAPTAKTGLQGRFTASKMGLTKPKLEMSVPHKPQVFVKHLQRFTHGFILPIYHALMLSQSALALPNFAGMGTKSLDVSKSSPQTLHEKNKQKILELVVRLNSCQLILRNPTDNI